MMRSGACAPGPPGTVLRFVRSERLLHWAIAIPFLGCLASALVLVGVYNPAPTRPYRLFFAWIHRGCGSGLILFPSLVLLANVRRWRVHAENIHHAWVWRVDDVKWLALMGPAAVSPGIRLPDQGKFNAAEKLNFMMVMVFSPLLIVSGVLMWFPEISRLGSFAPWLVHCALVAMAIPLVLGHVFMATINPGTRVGLSGMISGFVSREWAAHHYARWFREQFPDLVKAHDGDASRDVLAAPVGSEATAIPPPPSTTGPLVAESSQGVEVLAASVPVGTAASADSLAGETRLHASAAEDVAEPRCGGAPQVVVPALPLHTAADDDYVGFGVSNSSNGAVVPAMAPPKEPAATAADAATTHRLARHSPLAAREVLRPVGQRGRDFVQAADSSLPRPTTPRAAVGWSR